MEGKSLLCQLIACELGKNNKKSDFLSLSDLICPDFDAAAAAAAYLSKDKGLWKKSRTLIF